MRDVGIPNWLKELPLAPVFHPTDTEFADPIAYISKIEKEASAFGICKVIPPLPKPSRKYVIANLNKSLLKCPELGNDVKLNNVEKGDGDVQAVFTTRHQELGHNSGKRTKEVNKQVWQSGEIYTLDQFESKSKIFARSQLGMVKETPPLSVESLFWKASCEKPIYIEYANDVPGSGFGEPVGTSRFVHKHGRRRRRTFRRNDKDCYKTNNCDDPKGESVRCSPSSSVDMLKKDVNSLNMLSDRVPRQRGSSSNGGQEIEGSSSWKLSNCPWNLQVIARSPGSLTRFMPDDIPGVTSPMVYIGMLFSWFAWHVEDHELHSLNFLHMGSPKTWYAVPGDYAFTFEEVIRSKAYGGGIDRLAALTLLGEKTTLLSPETVVASGIPCCRLVQNPGEFVVTFPRAYHIGFSHGFNCGEAANFGTPKWLSVAKEAAVRRAAMNFLPMLSHQHLLYLLTMSFIPRVPRSLLPGIRTSRLKNRQKEERELLVKKEFLEDILKENKLLTSILQKNTSYRAVIWDIESLSPSIIKESDSSNITPDNTKKVHVENNNSLDSFDQMSQEMETLLHMEEDDMSSDFQIDSGTLPCVTCGVLGYPFMSVIQPSVYMFMDNNNNNINNIIPVKDCNVIQDLGIQNYSNSMDEDSLSDELDRSLEASKDSSKANICNGWNTSNGYLRPRIFCLEHASKIEELLVSKGGAKLLIICHSDFQKIKIQAAAIAEQIGSAFIYNDIQLGNANREDLDLINLAIDNEQEDESLEDWTLKLNINLRQSIKLKDKLSPDKINHALPLDALFSDTTPASSAVSLQWQATKTRSNRKLNRSIKESSKSELKEKLSEAQTPKKEAILIQYSRRNFKFKSKPQDFVTNLGKNLSERVSSVVKNHEKLVGENSLGTVSCATSIENSGTEKDGGNGEKTDVQNEASDVLTENDSGLMQEGLELVEPGGAGADEPVADLNIGNDENTPGSSCFTSRNGSERADEPITDLDIGNDENTPGLGCFTSRNGSKRADEPVTDLDIGNDENTPGSSCFASRNESNSGIEPVTALNPGNDENTPGSSSRNGSKRKREAELSDFDGFIRSPCEGLRPRSRKDSHKNAISITIPEKSTKKTKTSVKIREKDENRFHVSHRCDQEGCKLSFRTKTELSLHKKNRCPHEGCGKKFSSHRYAVLHLRVHDDDRPLKCTWKGCKMTFKWAWARTEHLRVHTGERPYKCNVEGCDRTFRFVSDYSRHRRKTGHNVHVKE